jgi:hypothetical protein
MFNSFGLGPAAVQICKMTATVAGTVAGTLAAWAVNATIATKWTQEGLYADAHQTSAGPIPPNEILLFALSVALMIGLPTLAVALTIRGLTKHRADEGFRHDIRG